MRPKFSPVELIQKKQLGQELTREELQYLIEGYTADEIPDYQMSAWLMAVYFKGMSSSEISHLTEFMKNSGEIFDFSDLGKPRVDKHSTGGVGDKTTLLIGPICAACELHVPMIAGRGLGHTGGTLDKFESIPGFNSNLKKDQFIEIIKKHHFALLSQTDSICPADRKIYALRDVTGTVASLPLICGSIMSKKLAEDLSGLVLDVKFGSGAFMKSLDEAIGLAQTLISIGKHQKVRTVALLSSMEQPLGRFIGNGLEVKETLDILSGESCLIDSHDYYESTKNLSLRLAGYMLWLGEKASSPEEGVQLAQDTLESGKALKAFENLIEYQGPGDLAGVKRSKNRVEVQSPRSGYIKAIDTQKIGMCAVDLGAGRRKTNDTIDPTAGIEINCFVGKPVQQGDVLFYLESDSVDDFSAAQDKILQTLEWSESPTEKLDLIAKVIL